MVRIKVTFFGPAKDWAKLERTTIELADGATLGSLRHYLSEQYAGLRAALGSVRFAVREEFANDEARLRTGDEVALIPPVSGG